MVEELHQENYHGREDVKKRFDDLAKILLCGQTVVLENIFITISKKLNYC